MTRLRGRTLVVPGFVKGLIQDMDADSAPLGSYAAASNLVPTPAGRLAIRGGSRLIATLEDDAGTPAELTHLLRIHAFSPVGFVVVGWSNGRDRHYAYRMTSDGAFFTGAQATSRTDLSAAPSTSWDNASSPARPLMAELWEKLFLVDATVDYASRNTLLSFDASGTVLEPNFDFGAGAAALKPYCLAEYNNVLFVAGYDDDSSEPAIVRHSFLGRSPDDVTVGAEGFDPRAWAIFGAKGQRVTAMEKGNNILLVAKANELYRVSGFGRAYPGWQYQIELVNQTLGLGVANPFALTFAEGYWYGIGAQGPFRTDGFTVESLRGPRELAWTQTTDPETQFVEYHPDRSLICFGVRQPVGLPDDLYLVPPFGGSTPSTYPNVLWTWDIARGVYGPDLGFGLSLFHIRAIPSTTAQTPSANPTATAASGTSATGFTANWTNGDATAQTEYYEKAGVAGSYGLVSTEAAAATSKARTGRTAYTRYFYKLVHIKSGIRSSESNEIEAKTHLPAPVVTSVTGSTIPFIPSELIVTLAVSGATLYVQQSADGVSGWTTVQTVPSAPAGTHSFFNGSGVNSGFYYRAYSEDLAWTPTTGANSNVEFLNPETGP